MWVTLLFVIEDQISKCLSQCTPTTSPTHSHPWCDACIPSFTSVQDPTKNYIHIPNWSFIRGFTTHTHDFTKTRII